MILVTQHALRRFQERVEYCSLEDARERILAAHRGIETAADLGGGFVRLASGARLVLDGLTVLTVYAPHALPRQCRNSHRPIAQREWQ